MKTYSLSIADDGFTGYAYWPESDPGNAAIVLTGSDGGLENAKYIAELFARRGIAALAVAYFRYPGLTGTLELIPLEYAERAAEWIKSNTGASKVSLYGVSKGAEYALSVAARSSSFESVVAVVPNYCVTEGLGEQLFGKGVSSWTYQGNPLPYLPLSRDMDAFNATSEAEQQMSIKTLYELAEKDGVPNEAIIPVEKSAARILLLSSTQDNVWPSQKASEKILERLKGRNYSYAYKHINFENASHVLNPVPPEMEKLLPQVSRAERENPKECSEARGTAFDLAVAWLDA
jgi:dienelactone hydrolase